MSRRAVRPRRRPAAATETAKVASATDGKAQTDRAIVLAAHATCRDALLALLASVRRQIEPSRRLVLDTDHPEGPHQLRVGLRRLRSGLKAFEPLLDCEAAGDLDDAAQAMARTVGRLRNASVLADDICRPALNEPGGDVAALASVLAADLSQAKTAVRKALAGPGWTSLLRRLDAFELTLATNATLERPAKAHARVALKRLWKKAAQRGKRIDDLDDAERHELRIAVKRLRYGVDLFGSLYDRKRVRAYREHLRTLQDGLGYLNDVAEAQRLIDIVARDDAPRTSDRAVAEAVLAWHAERAATRWPATRKQWLRLAKVPRFWR